MISTFQRIDTPTIHVRFYNGDTTLTFRHIPTEEFNVEQHSNLSDETFYTYSLSDDMLIEILGVANPRVKYELTNDTEETQFRFHLTEQRDTKAQLVNTLQSARALGISWDEIESIMEDTKVWDISFGHVMV